VIAYASRVLNDAEKNYAATEKEALLGTKFLIETDHSALQWLFAKKQQSGILSRWNQRLAEYEFEIIHKPGKSIPHVDALSRSFSVNIITEAQANEFKEEQLRDKSLNTLRQQIVEISNHTLQPNSESFILQNEILYRIYTPNNPTTRRMDIMRSFHESPLAAHIGEYKTFTKIADKYWWPSKNMPLQPIAVPLEPFHTIAMDIVGPLTKII